jgi:hypothetical protein
MVRDKLFGAEYFSEWIDFAQSVSIDENRKSMELASDAEGKVLYGYDLAEKSMKLINLLYSRGDAISDMIPAVEQAIDMLDLYKTTLHNIQIPPNIRQMHERLSLSHLQRGLSLLSFVVSLGLPGVKMERVVNLIGKVGEDALLDRIAIRLGESREQISRSKFPKVYDSLIAITEAPAEKQPYLLMRYVSGWYRSMKAAPWHNNHKDAEGAYFGYWCFEAALVAMLWNIDDSALEQHENYPHDLVQYYRAQSHAA